jgi:hypothetical protein
MSAESLNTPEVPTQQRRSPRWPWLLAVVVVLLLGGWVAGSLTGGGGDSAQALPAQRLASVQSACGQWQNSYVGSPRPPEMWCGDMVSWMGDNIRTGTMTVPGLRDNPAGMFDPCLDWLSGTNTSGVSSDWWGPMMTWMQNHAGTCDSWHHGRPINGHSMTHR